MTKQVKNHGLSACKSPDGISIQTKDWGAEVCVARHDDTLTITIHHDGDDTPMTVEIPLTSNPYIFDPRTQSAAFVAPRSHMGSGKGRVLRKLAKTFPRLKSCYFDCTTKDLGDIKP